MTMLPDLFGLYVDCGHYSVKTGRWLREPFAEFTCRAGCVRCASGPAQVAHFVAAIWTWHTRNCPGGTTTDVHP
jgi:hypothetical protein